MAIFASSAAQHKTHNRDEIMPHKFVMATRTMRTAKDYALAAGNPINNNIKKAPDEKTKNNENEEHG
ncbi:MAG: hypothetical protein A3A33_03380 [Candidatus Yanofskybacteria bacterium RIFCSPLOWO2_01_FULL_49_25]|uniref:Uncharacterized protein n=1 Tax=Candidatus Yanofskybacteria bacterium RIFCSPLOWO2_01_FULL_49_25 TaxID=1802701 RepID=A0A1F8GVW4_9BACT|nr:MAG: hypothetical protein A3A33_03380 [Candidatus Yanofskybacteria bacterium RIFCSPLOWO2_01_FULL_49_25]